MRIDLAGFGPGASDLATQQVWQALSEADLILSSPRLVQLLQEEERFCPRAGARLLAETDSGRICKTLEQASFDRAVCLFGGDSSFYSGAAPLLRLIGQSSALQNEKPKIRLLPGISSLSAACAASGLSFRELEVFSAHGRACDPVKAVMNGKKSFFLTGGKSSPERLCRELVCAGLGALRVTVLERLSLPGERVLQMTAEEASGQKFDPLSVLIADPAPVSEALRRRVPGIPDSAFIRGKVPMTKQMVRVCALSLLDPGPEDVCWDLGAGTGSVSIELAACCRRVICVERSLEAVSLMEENRRKFGAWNMQIVPGELPGILESLPAPDRVFLGGGGKWIREILRHFSGRTLEPETEASDGCPEHAAKGTAGKSAAGKPAALLATAVSLETLHQVRCALEESGYEVQVVQLAVTNVTKRGSYHMLDAQNPVFLILGKDLRGDAVCAEQG